MLFSSMIFIWIFLPILLLIYFVVGNKYKNIVLLVFSLIFYAWGEPKYIIVMIFSIIINYIYGILIDKYNKKSIKLPIFIFAILSNVLILCYFKYLNFIIDNINILFHASLFNKNIILPIGISFYTFQIMSYIIDLYRGKIVVEKNIFSLALYICFFPQLIAGPIVKYKDIHSQIKKRTITIEGFASGCKRFIYGLSKKTLIANVLAYVVDTIFDAGVSNITTSLAWIGSVAYSLQIYFDFSGYSDMAIGLGKMFGFSFSENFDLPYKSRSITEFWRRWHISLSSWLKEYIYIPLGGNRLGKIRTYINLLIVFLITGIWHGAAWSFVAWGLYHWFFIIIEKAGLKKLLDKYSIFSHIHTLLIINFGWVLFRVDGLKEGIYVIKRMIIPSNNITLIRLDHIITTRNILVLIIAILFSGIVQFIFKKIKNVEKYKIVFSICEITLIVVLWILCISSLASNTYNPFIYFRF